jgi:hypothetical protein
MTSIFFSCEVDILKKDIVLIAQTGNIQHNFKYFESNVVGKKEFY